MGRRSKERGWWHEYGDVFGDFFAAFEAEASVISSYQPIVIPGLLQTAEYAAAVSRTSPARTEEEIDRMAAARMQRQEILRRTDAPDLRAVIDEHVLLRLAVMPDIADGQFRHLIEQAEAVNSEAVNSEAVQVLPISVGLHASTHGSMVILDYADERDPSIVYLETRSEGLYLEEPAQVAGYRTAFDHVCMDALSKADSIAFLRRFID
nr:DUF5753 domain-containing protein [Nocardiopsis mwathae]